MEQNIKTIVSQYHLSNDCQSRIEVHNSNNISCYPIIRVELTGDATEIEIKNLTFEDMILKISDLHRNTIIDIFNQEEYISLINPKTKSLLSPNSKSYLKLKPGVNVLDVKVNKGGCNLTIWYRLNCQAQPKFMNESDYIVVNYTIDGIYGRVEYNKPHKKNDLITIEDIIKNDKLRFSNSATPSYSVIIKNEHNENLYSEFEIEGLPYGITEDMYFRMAQLREMNINKVIKIDNEVKLEDMVNKAVKLVNEKLIKDLHSQGINTSI